MSESKTYRISGLLMQATWYRVDFEIEADSEEEALLAVNEGGLNNEVRCEDSWIEGPFVECDEEEDDEDRTTVTCYFCAKEFPDSECIPADEFNGNDGGEICESCVKVMPKPGEKDDE